MRAAICGNSAGLPGKRRGRLLRCAGRTTSSRMPCGGLLLPHKRPGKRCLLRRDAVARPAKVSPSAPARAAQQQRQLALQSCAVAGGSSRSYHRSCCRAVRSAGENQLNSSQPARRQLKVRSSTCPCLVAYRGSNACLGSVGRCVRGMQLHGRAWAAQSAAQALQLPLRPCCIVCLELCAMAHRACCCCPRWRAQDVPLQQCFTPRCMRRCQLSDLFCLFCLLQGLWSARRQRRRLALAYCCLHCAVSEGVAQLQPCQQAVAGLIKHVVQAAVKAGVGLGTHQWPTATSWVLHHQQLWRAAWCEVRRRCLLGIGRFWSKDTCSLVDIA